MKARHGQVALYLAFVLLGLTFLLLMNVGVFVAVRARNHAMNAGDAAALAVAVHQGKLLNEIGRDNLEHLRRLATCVPAAGESSEAADARREACRAACDEIVQRQRRTCFLEPLDGIGLANAAAQANGAERSDEMLALLQQHVRDVRLYYETTPEAYPEPWDGAWEEYARQLEVAIGGGLWAAPDNADFMDQAGGHLLLDPSFYAAVNGRSWCWFHFNAPSLLNSYIDRHSWGPLPAADSETRRRRSANCEIYSLHLVPRTGSARDLLGEELIARLLGTTADEIADSDMLNDPDQTFFFYDDGTCCCSHWHSPWYEIDPFGEWKFPVVGKVKDEYDVRGCAAICRVRTSFQTVVIDNETRRSEWAAAAKPFGTVTGEDGTLDVVTALRGLVTPAFTDARLVPLDAVGGRDTATADVDWMIHLRDHLSVYLQLGPSALHGSCDYCQALKTWEHAEFRRAGSRWLKFHAGECRRPQGSGGSIGGTPHGH